MNVRKRRIVAIAALAAAIVSGVGLSTASAEGPTTQPAATEKPAATFPYVGRVTGAAVNVRSGPDLNYYRVTKLDRGDQVVVYAREYNWLSIGAPKGTYSLIDRSYVDKSDDGKGTVNGENVWVRAGSDLDNHRYAKQTKLNKGDTVTILGETSDGAFYKIEPPEGARLWISADYVEHSDGSIDAAKKSVSKMASSIHEDTQHSAPPPAGAARPGTTITYTERRDVTTPTTQPASPFGAYAETIGDIDAEIAEEANKPLTQQRFKPFIERLRPIAEQDDEPVAKIYAERRIDQLETKIELIATLQDIETLQSESDQEHTLGRRVRESIRIPPDKVIDGRVEARGELRPSQVFTAQSRALPHRYRLVDPKSQRTVAYVDVSDAGDPGIRPYIGKYVAVRANQRRLTPGTVEPISILTPDEIVEVEPEGKAPGMIELPRTTEASALPTPEPATGEPTTRPATTQPAR
jgi:uncharacterized protein YraI